MLPGQTQCQCSVVADHRPWESWPWTTGHWPQTIGRGQWAIVADHVPPSTGDRVRDATPRRKVYVPGQQEMVPVSACTFLPEEHAGLAGLLGRHDVGGVYPSLRDFFVRRLGVQSELLVGDCLAALGVLRREGVETDEDAMARSVWVWLSLNCRHRGREGIRAPPPGERAERLYAIVFAQI